MKNKIRIPAKPTNAKFIISDSSWPELEYGLNAILNKNSSSVGFEVLYRCGYNLCLNKKEKALYDDAKALMSQFFKFDKLTLHELLEIFKDYQVSLYMIRDVLMYLVIHFL
jgi:hypothetical protein